MLLMLLACATETTEKPAGVVYYGQVDKVLQDNCARCHTDGGQARSFDNPQDVQAMASSIVAMVDANLMPPPAPDPGCKDYLGSANMILDGAETSLLRTWLAEGAQMGEESHATIPSSPVTLYPFDLELRAKTPYTPSFADGQNDYRCFRYDVKNQDTKYITGIEALVDNPAIVHHVVVYDATGVNVSDDPTGFDCDGFGERGWSFLAGWAPGGRPATMPEGTGIPIGPSSTLVLQMHYYNSFDGADREVDQSGYGLLLADSVEKEAYVESLGTNDFVIPADNPAYESTMIVPWQKRWGTGHILGVFPHMHLLGSGFDLSIVHEDSSQECLVKMDGWDFHNQATSFYLEESVVTGGDTVYLRCMYDNSASNPNQPSDPPQDVVWGEGTGDEMCFGFTYMYFD